MRSFISCATVLFVASVGCLVGDNADFDPVSAGMEPPRPPVDPGVLDCPPEAPVPEGTRCVHIAPDGNDAEADGSAEAPFLSVDEILLEARQKGYAIVFLPGDYGRSIVGLDCGGDLSTRPFLIWGSDRQARFEIDDGRTFVSVKNCTDVEVVGFSMHTTGGRSGALRVHVDNSQEVVLRDLLVSGTPEPPTTTEGSVGSVLVVSNSQGVILEDIEIYDFPSHGVFVLGSSDVAVRRVHVASMGRADVEGCEMSSSCTGNPDRGDWAFSAIASERVTFENTISIGNGVGWRLIEGETGIGTPGGARYSILGSLSIDDSMGLFAGRALTPEILEQEPDVERDPVSELVVADVAVVRPGNVGMKAIDLRAATVRAMTVFGAQGDGMQLEATSRCEQSLEGCSGTFSRTLIVQSGQSGVATEGAPWWVMRDSNVWSSGVADYPTTEAVEDAEGAFQTCRSDAAPEIGVGEGQCVAFLPPQSPMRGLASDGSDIGADVSALYEQGERTTQPLWNEMGDFPCGDVVGALNDHVLACSRVGELLGVGEPNCVLP